ncbi:IS66 family insertion sequence element accessory protein TnpB, partial [Pseudomonas syringae]|uniref:IS66 family insertion sequence element accessory protein TnpB n=1 Tax=Pseudomonas syringae TaxID=317 RepID=UPI001EF9F155
MMRPDTKVEKVYLYPKPVDFRKSIDGLAALVELDINRHRGQPSGCTPATPPGMRVRTGRFERLRSV